MNKISTRLTLLVGVLAALLVAIGGLGLFGMSRSSDALRSVYLDNMLPAAQLGQIRALQLTNRLDVNLALVDPRPETIAARTAQIDANRAQIGKLWDAYMATNMTVDEARLAETFVKDRLRFVQEALAPTVVALRGNDLKEALRLNAEKVRPMSAPMEQDLDALVQVQVDGAKARFDEASARTAMIRTASIAAIAGGLLFVGLYGLGMVRSIGRQLGAEPGEAALLAQSVASGDLSNRVDLRPGDSTSLMAQLEKMQASLSTVVNNVRQNSESVATASAQIAQGNNDLSSRTEQQASALEQTAASMEELSATVKQNAENARQASQLAQDASSVAVRGGAVVGKVVDTMKGINDSSKKIADIIGVIDGIAFQTNILALNAAVEAARAGEQGRGFAVVASEVRSLAGRSADAAKQIKALIAASVERAEQGTELVNQAGATMTEVVTSIQRVTDIVADISAASAEQSTGVSQVGDAVGQMDQVTQQNAALVEESAAAAESLREQALQLVRTVSVFRLEAGRAEDAAAHGKASASLARAKPARAPMARHGHAPAAKAVRPAPAKAAPQAIAAGPATGTGGWDAF